MEAILKNKTVFGLFLMLISLSSCGEKAVFNEYKALENATWEAHKKINFEFDIKDTISAQNLFINIRNNNHYKYSNLYMITVLNFPNGTRVIDTLQYEMTDNAGHFLGTGITSIKENKLFYKENKVFPVAGRYSFSVHQAMRKNNEIKPIPFLEGITDLGLSIEKLN
jgi:gliding motility-associated lipoprotein GldH